MTTNNPRHEAQFLIGADAVSLFDLWLKYWGEGGQGDELELDAFIHGVALLDDFDEVILGWAVDAFYFRHGKVRWLTVGHEQGQISHVVGILHPGD